ncbi:hypothetical protein LX36DRAFT_683434 [Colletotrichum falcatum]|nr:hypothetical protein LX36DRAFT_683434 [Colletotrichum falcatum]
MRTQFAAPNVSNTHFSDAALESFKSDFFNPNQQSDAVNADLSFEEDGDIIEEDDGLGYYADGVKRTLTDEQIAMFRHSELEALRREQERAAERRSTVPYLSQAGEAGDDGSVKATESSYHPTKANRNKKKRKGGKGKPQEPKPDLRKRTWDVVEAGLDTLDYD